MSEENKDKDQDKEPSKVLGKFNTEMEALEYMAKLEAGSQQLRDRLNSVEAQFSQVLQQQQKPVEKPKEKPKDIFDDPTGFVKAVASEEVEKVQQELAQQRRAIEEQRVLSELSELKLDVDNNAEHAQVWAKMKDLDKKYGYSRLQGGIKDLYTAAIAHMPGEVQERVRNARARATADAGLSGGSGSGVLKSGNQPIQLTEEQRRVCAGLGVSEKEYINQLKARG